MKFYLFKRASFIYNVTVLFLLSFLIQFIQFDIGLSILKPFMILSMVCLILFFSKIKFSKFYNHELFWILSFVIIFASFFYAEDKLLALKVILGQFILIISFIIFRFLLDRISLESFEQILISLGKFYVLGSLSLYILGIVSYYILHIMPSQSNFLNEYAIRIYGLYLEGAFPRMMGLAESPNNYAYFANIFFWFFVYKRKKMMILLCLLSLVLTISSSTFIVLFFQTLIFLVYSGKKVFIPIIFFFSSVIATILYYYYSNDTFQSIVNYRLDRNMTGSGRLGLYEYVWGLIIKSPIVGYGANQSRLLIEPYRELMSTHNSLLEMLLTTGVLGFLSYLLFLFFLLRNSYFLSKRYCTAIFIILATGFVLYGFTNNTLHIEYSVFILGFLYAYNGKLRLNISKK